MRWIHFLGYLLKAHGRHGIHSPFIYGLINFLSQKEKYSPWQSIGGLRRELLRTTRQVYVLDYGTGKSGVRRVSAMTRSGATGKLKGQLLTRLADRFEPDTILELGTHLGLGTAYLAAPNHATVTTIEGCPHTRQLAQENFSSLGMAQNICSLGGEFSAVLDKELKTARFDFVFLDGNHTYSATKGYIKELWPITVTGGVWVFDDIRWSAPMWRVWKEIVESSDFPITIDFGMVGVVVFRKGQAAQHFTLRFW